MIKNYNQKVRKNDEEDGPIDRRPATRPAAVAGAIKKPPQESRIEQEVVPEQKVIARNAPDKKNVQTELGRGAPAGRLDCPSKHKFGKRR